MGLRETDLLWGAASYDQPTALLQEGDAVTGHAQTAALRVGVTVNVDDDVVDGWLRFDDVTLVKVSDPFAVTAALPYRMEALKRGTDGLHASGVLQFPGDQEIPEDTRLAWIPVGQLASAFRVALPHGL